MDRLRVPHGAWGRCAERTILPHPRPPATRSHALHAHVSPRHTARSGLTWLGLGLGLGLGPGIGLGLGLGSGFGLGLGLGSGLGLGLGLG